ncbi:TatD family hydrolase [Sideroxydans lithotrophicus]|uniref:TatD-related deoxyribonuclease n=1 Tax=Sideroxydans lithotrophicus (strain ES-1) TaxID=580332 RepID=D5CLJ1_SIDLE|nr:TatD family hydrolase [Sideroxydans lithotrophicus]ADE10579.1 TatD-related deoxyribonuclease [Sideroxydans lithotrophicus ES-1]
MFVDTHCHLDAAEFGGTQTEVVRNAAAVGVNRLIIPSVACSNFETVRELCEQYPNCAPAYGIHPMYTDNAIPRDLEVLRDHLKQHSAIAVGEIGLDFFIPHYDQVRQEHFLVEQLKLARDFDLPVLLHIRRAQDTILKHLRQIRVRGGIAHAFNGSHQQADEFIKLGFKLGFGGAMTYSRATKLRELAATLPLDSIVLETDAPDIPPDFLERGLPNEPKYLPRIAQTLAELRGMSLEETARATTENSLAVLPALIPTHLGHLEKP